jgi:hypothetical protein
MVPAPLPFPRRMCDQVVLSVSLALEEGGRGDEMLAQLEDDWRRVQEVRQGRNVDNAPFMIWCRIQRLGMMHAE